MYNTKNVNAMRKVTIVVALMAAAVAAVAQGQGPFCGRVGTEGCDAIVWNDPSIVAWATGCSVVRGSRNMSNPSAAPVTFGDSTRAIGPASTSVYGVVSLGDGGSATLTFDVVIADGPGPDLVVFENPFDDYFLELAFVEVSSDGEHFVRFPATSLTQTATQVCDTGHLDATNLHNLAGKYRVGYGTPFDLADLADSAGVDISAVTHVRVVDVVGSIDPQWATYDAYGHMVNDPFPTISYSGGFDLDAVGVLHTATESVERVKESRLRVWPNPARERLMVSGRSGSTAVLSDMRGRVVAIVVCGEAATMDIETLPAGVYILRVDEEVKKIVKR